MRLLPVTRALPRSRRGALAPAAIAAALIMTIANAGVVFAWSNLTFSSTDESLMVTLTNQARASSGLKSLLTDSTLTSIARTRAKYIWDNSWLQHCAKPNTSCTTPMYVTLLKNDGYCYKVAGENIGENNFPDDQTTQWQFNWFMGSSTHRANILGTGYDHIGVGAYKGTGAAGSLINHVFVMVFAQKCSSSPTPTPRPTATPKPTPKPTATPRPTATPKPTPRPTPKPTATPRPTATPHGGPTSTPDATDPGIPTTAPTASPTPEITAEPSSEAPNPADVPGTPQWRLQWRIDDATNAPGFPAGSPEPAAEPTPDGGTGSQTSADLGLQVVDPVPDQSLLDAIVGGVLSSYLGQ
jgi:uncharacterized protein YkwD